MEEQALKDAQYRKALAIAYFNSVNSAITLMAPAVTELIKTGIPDEEKFQMIKAGIRVFRDWFIEEHKNHYLKTVAEIGKPYDKEKTIEKLVATKTKEELRSVWVSLSEDERRDPEIKNKCLELVKEYDPA